MIGKLKVDIYQASGRYPLDYGESYTKEEIDGMFEKVYSKGDRLYRVDDGDEHFAWYTKNNDGGWGEFHDIEMYLQGVEYHSILSNLEIVKDNRK